MKRKLMKQLPLVALALVATIIVGSLTSASSPSIAPFASGELYAPDRILVRFKPGVDAATIAALHRAQGAVVIREIPKIGVQVLRVPANQVLAKVAAYSRNPNVLYAEPDYTAQALGDPNDEHFAKQWGLDNDGQVYDGQSGTVDADIDAPEAWDIITGTAEIKIAILDTGIDQDHEDLGKIVANVNFTNSPTVDDKYGHGTHVAGIAAADTNNTIGVAGVGYNSSLLNVKVLGDNGRGWYSWVAEGIVWATDYGAKVINMSLGGGSPSDTLEAAVNYAWGKGVVLAAAAGNSNDDSPLYPAYYANCIAVAATDDDDVKASFSSYGDWVDVAAPGVDIYSTFPNHKYRIRKSLNYDYGSGTSMASPHVAGLAGLLFGQDPLRTNSDVRTLIEETADTTPDTGTYWIYGRINACNAVGGTCEYTAELPSNTAPTADDKTVSTNEDMAVTITLTASDPEECELTFSIVDPPTYGTLSGITDAACTSGDPNTDSATVTYTPNPDFNGNDSFTYKANDGTVDSDIATVSITVNAVNDAPVANDDSATTQVDTAVTIDVLANDSDVDGDSLTVTNLTQPANGSVTLNVDNTVTYTPTSGFTGEDSFTYTANDGTVDSNIATVTVTVVSNPPTADDKSVSTDEDTPVEITLSGSDEETCDLSFSIVSGPSNGTLSAITDQPCTSGTPNKDTALVTYTPNADYNGSDSFVYQVTDAEGASDEATVSITVNAVNDAPVANDDSATTDEDTAVTIDVLANDSDVDGDSLTVTNLTQPANGSVTLNVDNTVTYTPNADYNGSDSFTYTANDGTVDSNIATVSITVNPVNDAPVANDVSDTTTKNTSDTWLPDVSDVDGDTLSCTADSTSLEGGAVTVASDCSSGMYDPPADFTGTDSFSYTVSDGSLTDSATVTYGVTEPAPVFFDDLEGDTSGWSTSGLWHLANDIGCTAPDLGYTSATHSFYYGQDSTCDYDTFPKANTGALTSPAISDLVVGTDTTTLSFYYWREVESYSGGSYDQTYVQVSYDGGGSWTTVWFKDSTEPSQKDWIQASISLSPESDTMLIRFVFDTVDRVDNDQVGWLIDDVTVDSK